jgi:hypothetical protein
MKVLITALALVTLIASPTFAQRPYPGEFYPVSYESPAILIAGPAFTQSARKAGRLSVGTKRQLLLPGEPVWHCWEDVRCSAR